MRYFCGVGEFWSVNSKPLCSLTSNIGAPAASVAKRKKQRRLRVPFIRYRCPRNFDKCRSGAGAPRSAAIGYGISATVLRPSLRAYRTKLKAAKSDRNIVNGETLTRSIEKRTRLSTATGSRSSVDPGRKRPKRKRGMRVQHSPSDSILRTRTSIRTGRAEDCQACWSPPRSWATPESYSGRQTAGG